MNEVILSAMLKGGFEEVSRDGIKFTLVIQSDYEDSGFEEYTCLAYGNSANFLKQHAESGDRLVVQGRLSSEKFEDDGPYHTAMTVSRVLSIAESSRGMDFSHITVVGEASSDGLITIGSGTTLANLDIKNVRTYTDRKSGEIHEYTTYLSATVWKDRAEELDRQGVFDLMPDRDNRALVLIDGILKPRSYENKDKQTVEKIDIWVNDLTVLGEQAESAPVEREAPKKRSAPAKKKSPF